MNQSRMMHARDIFTRVRELGADPALVLILGFGSWRSREFSSKGCGTLLELVENALCCFPQFQWFP